MKDLKINALIHHEVYIDPKDAFEQIKNALGFDEDYNNFICVKNGELKRGKDVSCHGSPYYKYETVSNNPKWIELYNSIKCLNDYFLHSEKPEWNRIIDCDEDMNENNDPVMSM